MIYFVPFSQAVSRHSCTELLNVHESEIQAILQENLEPALKPKIRRIDRINKLLAHRPWAVKRHHIKVSPIPICKYFFGGFF